MNNFTFLAIPTASVKGSESLLGSLDAQAHSKDECKLLSGNFTTSRITDQSTNIVELDNVGVWASGLAGVAAAMTMMKLEVHTNGVIVSSPFPTAWDLRFTSLDTTNHLVLMLKSASKSKTQVEASDIHMLNSKTEKLVSTLAPVVITKTKFALRTRPAIAPKGLQKGTFIAIVNESGGESGSEFNRVVVTVELEAVDKNSRFQISKAYNILSNGRGVNAFCSDYNSWSGLELTEDGLYDEFDMDVMIKGKSVVVEIGHRKNGKDWEAFIEAFHPADATETLAA